MASRPDITLPIDVRGDVCLVSPSGRQVTLRASGSELCLAVPGWAEFGQLGPRSLLARLLGLASADIRFVSLVQLLKLRANAR